MRAALRGKAPSELPGGTFAPPPIIAAGLPGLAPMAAPSTGTDAHIRAARRDRARPPARAGAPGGRHDRRLVLDRLFSKR